MPQYAVESVIFVTFKLSSPVTDVDDLPVTRNEYTTGIVGEEGFAPVTCIYTPCCI